MSWITELLADQQLYTKLNPFHRCGCVSENKKKPNKQTNKRTNQKPDTYHLVIFSPNQLRPNENSGIFSEGNKYDSTGD